MTLDRAAVVAAIARCTQPSSDFDLHPESARPEGRALKPAGVLVALEPTSAGFDVILTKRSSALKNHAGQIAFAGGRQDPEDADVTAAALREAHEEIGLPLSHVDVLGLLPAHETVTRYDATPVVGIVTKPFTEMPEAGEVAEVFRVPLTFLANPAHYRIEGRRWQRARRAFYVCPYGPYYIWGATARMLHTLATGLQR